MKKAKVTSTSEPKTKMRPALSTQAVENQMINLAINLAEKQLRDGTASSQVITHFLKLATEEKRLERERLIEENKLLRAKTEQIQSQKKTEELMAEAIKAMKTYSGNGDSDEY